MKYPLEESDFKPQEVGEFKRGKWYKCVLSNSGYFRREGYYLCVEGYFKEKGHKLYLVSENSVLISVDNISSKFSGPH